MKNILIVDDSSVVRMSLGYVLKENEYTVVEAVDGVDGLEKSNNEKFDLIITDMTMPKMSGDELSQNILKLRPDIPIILCNDILRDIAADIKRYHIICHNRF